MIKQSLRMLFMMLLITGIVYPLLITLVAQATMHHKANGSLISVDGKTVGSSLIGQKFESEKYFWGRPSAVDYNPLNSGGSNLAAGSAVLKKQVEERRTKLEKTDSFSEAPSDLLFASGSGLDPHITVDAALFQKERVSKSRGYAGESAQEFENLIERLIEERTFGFLGTPHINVLELNLALDQLQVKP